MIRQGNNTGMTALLSMVSHFRRNRQLKQIMKANLEKRGVFDLGCVPVDHLIPLGSSPANLCIYGGTYDDRNLVLLQSLRQSLNAGQACVIIHDHNSDLETAIRNEFNHSVIINDQNPIYEPVYGKQNSLNARLLMSAVTDKKIPPEGYLYLQGMLKYLSSRNAAVNIRTLASAPHDRLQNLVAIAEASGKLSVNDADSIRNDLTTGINARASIEQYLIQLASESRILASKSNLKHAVSIEYAVGHQRVICIDIGSYTNTALLSVIAAELHFIHSNNVYRLILDIGKPGTMDYLDMLDNTGSSCLWTVSTDNLDALGKNRTNDWISRSDLVFIFKQNSVSSKKLSDAIGEYTYTDISSSDSYANNYGKFGLNWSANSGLTYSEKKAPVFEAKEFFELRPYESIIINNIAGEYYTAVFL